MVKFVTETTKLFKYLFKDTTIPLIIILICYVVKCLFASAEYSSPNQYLPGDSYLGREENESFYSSKNDF